MSFLQAFLRFLTDGFTGNLVAGLVGSIVTWLLVALRERRSQRRRFGDYEGLYETFTVDHKRIGDETVTVKWLGGNVIFARAENSDGTWESYITLDNAVPQVGSGFFQYLTRIDFGVHQLQRNLQKDTVFVFAHNPALNKPTVAYLWKKATQMPSIDAAQQHVAADGAARRR